MIDLTKLRVLLVEDDELDQRVMARHLERYEPTDYIVDVVGSLGEGLAALHSGEFDCVLLDLSLPDSEGLASIQALLDKAPGIAVVVLTGLDDPAVAVAAVEHGAQDYLTKQRVDTELVGRSVRYAVARQHGEAELRSTQDLLGILQDRERIGRDLHDTVIQQLFATGMSLQGAMARATNPALRSSLESSVAGIDDAIRQLREAIFGIHSGADSDPLSTAMTRVLSDETPALGFAPTLRVHPDAEGVAGDLRRELLATLREALSNVAKHAHASACEVSLDRTDGLVVLTVTDNGVGIDSFPVRPADHLSGRGLKNMTQRAEGLSGSLEVRPGPGGGTSLEWRAALPG